MFSDEGGVGTTSLSVRRSRARRGGVAWAGLTAAVVRLRTGGLAFLRAKGFAIAFLATSFRVAARLAAGRFETGRLAADLLRAFLTDFCGVRLRVGRFVLGRLTERAATLAFLAVARFTGRPPALRLAMMESFRNLDSFAISVVRSAAYRKSASPRVQAFTLASCSCYRTCGPPDPATKRR
jgi:hypothetical protein